MVQEIQPTAISPAKKLVTITGKDGIVLTARPLKKPEKTRWKMYLNRLVNYARSQNYTVRLNAKVDACFPEKRRIWIKKGKRVPETQIYILMRSLGQMLLYRRYGDYLEIARSHKISPRSFAYMVYELEEEIDAWRCGLDIGERFRVPVNAHNYETLKARHLSSYLQCLMIRKLKRMKKRAIRKERLEQEKKNKEVATSSSGLILPKERKKKPLKHEHRTTITKNDSII